MAVAIEVDWPFLAQAGAALIYAWKLHRKESTKPPDSNHDLESRVVALESSIVGWKGCEEKQEVCQGEIKGVLGKLFGELKQITEYQQANALILREVLTDVKWMKRKNGNAHD
jgi:hypothetical protein